MSIIWHQSAAWLPCLSVQHHGGSKEHILNPVFCLASSEFLWPDSIPLRSNFFGKLGRNCLMLQLKVGVLCCTLSNNIYLSAQSAVPKNQCG